MTNIALTIKLYPDFAEKVKDIHIMGGNYLTYGNSSVVSAEYNFWSDTEAAHIVLNSMKCPMTMLPWEAATAQNLNMETVIYNSLSIQYF